MIVFCWFADFDTVAPCNNTCLKDYLFRVECFPFWDFCTLLNAAWPDHFEDCSSAGVTRGSKGVGNPPPLLWPLLQQHIQPAL